MNIDRLLRKSSSVKTFDGFVYVNLLNGSFVETNSLRALTVQTLFPRIRTVYGSNHEIIGKRKNITDDLFSGHTVLKK